MTVSPPRVRFRIHHDPHDTQPRGCGAIDFARMSAPCPTVAGMTDDECWWEPPLAGTADEHLIGALDRLRVTFRWKADGLDSAGLNAKIGVSALTLGGLLKHLARVEDTTFAWKIGGASPGELWVSAPLDDTDAWEFSSSAEDSPEYLYGLWDDAVARSRDRLGVILAEGGLDEPSHLQWPGRGHFSVRRVVSDLVEEYGRHTGHADLLREVVDGRVGEDPPEGWRPVSGSGAWTWAAT